MIRHLVLFKLNDGVGHDEPRVRDGVRAFQELPGRISDVRSWEFARNVTDRPIAYDYAINCTVDDQQALVRYLEHPAHQAGVAQWQAFATWVIADYEI
ncbi:Dabb family protein [Streptantibioticus silvisoli]|uniref:Dabb family protein n=1 Tax=Streptantibioticus silvisoli TaxID=2705255 RepID=A0ABT6W5M1_9ACTN|nr:Dabb family protein [Streptantibioticus silvisoli]MDI5965680.1 Dabb family protein [Streptantibioticus silvisoli]